MAWKEGKEKKVAKTEASQVESQERKSLATRQIRYPRSNRTKRKANLRKLQAIRGNQAFYLTKIKRIVNRTTMKTGKSWRQVRVIKPSSMRCKLTMTTS